MPHFGGACGKLGKYYLYLSGWCFYPQSIAKNFIFGTREHPCHYAINEFC